MKKRHLIVINMIFIGLMVFSAATVIQYMTGRKPLQALASIGQKPEPVSVETGDCSDKPEIKGLEKAKATNLQKLKVYQDACHSYVTDTVMTFVGFPTGNQSADREAKQVIALLKEYDKYGVRPLVIAEPTDYASSENIDFALFASGAYNASLDRYFSQIKAAGITDAQMGIWNPFPEANLPYWNNNHPEHFAPAVNVYVSHLRKYFPKARTGVLLNSATYETTDFNWENGDYASWMPYLKGLTPGTIDYVGMQGFPWVSPQGGNGAILNAAEFLIPELLAEAADYLKIKQVWYNTGTFSRKYALDPERLATMLPERRKAVAATIMDQALILRDKGYTVSVNMFAEDKSRSKEETDWSYWSNNDPFSSLHTPVLTEFIASSNRQGISFWLFDK